MDALSQLYLPGAMTLWCAAVFALAAFWGYARVLQGDESALSFARRGYGFFALSVVFSAVVLALALWRRDFRIEYVYQYSGTDLESHFQLAAFWAGQKGSFLIWLMWGVLLGIPLSRTAGRDEPTVMLAYLPTVFWLAILLVRNNPFVMLPEAPADGAGLNPLLQDDWMVIHPPLMFVGYAAAAIPFAFAVGAMWRGDMRNWAARAFPWALGGFLVLGTAILLGGAWAYRTLGWGGYWGWDPVENASLIPWLIGVVLIHGLYLERSRGRYRRLNLLLSCLLYLSVLYGTFLTRSGVLADFSVHSFVDLGLSAWLIVIMATFAFTSLGLIVYRWRKVETRTNEDPILSRGTFLVLSTIIVGLSTLVVSIGTSAPLLTGWVMENPAQVGPEFYNTLHLPLALLAAAMLAAVPFLTWRSVPADRMLRQLTPSFVAALVVTVAGVLLGVAEVLHAVFLFFAAWALISNLHRVVQLARSSGLASTGGYLAHVGVGILLIGVLASSAYDFSAKATLPQGEPTKVGDLTLTFERFIPRQGWEKERMEVTVTRPNGRTYKSYPKLFVNDRTRQLMANPHIRVTLLRDFYISPIQYQPAEQPQLQLAKGQIDSIGDVEVRFVDFLLDQSHDPMIRLASGGQVEVGARLEVTRNGQTTPIDAAYRFRQDGQVDTPTFPLPGGGMVAMTGIDPTQGQVQLDFIGLGAEVLPARLAVDVTRKPLILLVWIGFAVILVGGGLSSWKRLAAARNVDAIDDRIAAAQAKG